MSYMEMATEGKCGVEWIDESKTTEREKNYGLHLLITPKFARQKRASRL